MIRIGKENNSAWFSQMGHLKVFLIERGVNVRGMKLEDMRQEIASHPDFRDEQPEIHNFLKRNGHACIFLTKISL